MTVRASQSSQAAASQRSFIAQWLCSLAFAIGMMLSGMIASLIMLLCPAPFSRRYRISQYWSQFTLWWLRVTCRIDYQLSGVENIPSQPVIVMAKHQSTWETLFLHYYLPPVAWVLKRELLWLPFFGWALARLRPIAINRRTGASAVKQVIRQGVNHLQQGQWVVIFPEGTRVLPGVRQRYGMGGAVLATHSGCPILPVALNAGECWPRGQFFKQPGTVQVVFGPLLVSEGCSPQALGRQVEAWIENEMVRISSVPEPSRTESAELT